MKIDLEALTIRDANLYIIQYTKYWVLKGVTCQACLFIFLRLHKLHGWQKKETNICHEANTSKALVAFAISFSDRISKKHLVFESVGIAGPTYQRRGNLHRIKGLVWNLEGLRARCWHLLGSGEGLLEGDIIMAGTFMTEVLG